MLSVSYVQPFGQFSTPTADAVRALQTAINQLIADPLNRVTINGQLTSETIGQIPIVARLAMDFMFENGLAVPPVLNRAAANQLTAETLAFDADTLIALTDALTAGAGGAAQTAPAQPEQPDIIDKLKAFFTSSGPSISVPQPPSTACAHGTDIDQETGASLDTSGVCVCPFGTVWDDPTHRCTSTLSNEVDPANQQIVQETLTEVQRDVVATIEPDVAREVISNPNVVHEAAAAANNAIQQAKAAGKSDAEQKAAGKEAAQKVVLDAAQKKKFFRVDNPIMWVSIGGGILGVVLIGVLVKSASARAATTAAAPAAVAPAAAVGRRRSRQRR